MELVYISIFGSGEAEIVVWGFSTEISKLAVK